MAIVPAAWSTATTVPEWRAAAAWADPSTVKDRMTTLSTDALHQAHQLAIDQSSSYA